MQECPPNKIRNPVSKRCVDIAGKVGAQLARAHKAKELSLDPEDVKKLVAAGILGAPGPQPKGFPVEKRLLRRLAEARERLALFKYVDEDHRKKCKEGDDPVGVVGSKAVTLEFKQTDIMRNPAERAVFVDKKIELLSYYNNFNKQTALMLVPDVDMVWFKAMDEYVSRLGAADIYCVQQYTGAGGWIIHNVLMKKTRPNSTYLATAFFQALELLKQGPNPEYAELEDSVVVKKGLSKYIPPKTYKIKKIFEIFEKKVMDDRLVFDFLTQNAEFVMSIKDVFWERCVDRYIKRLNAIIRGSPPVTRAMTVYRGQITDYFLKKSKAGQYSNPCFTSTSLSPSLPKLFTDVDSGCCLTKIRLLAGTRAMFVAGVSEYPKELEVLLPVGTVSQMLYGKKTIRVYISDDDAKSDVCGRELRRMLLTEAVVVK
jgi:hypothetical protein